MRCVLASRTRFHTMARFSSSATRANPSSATVLVVSSLLVAFIAYFLQRFYHHPITMAPTSDDRIILPANVRPSHYDLRITPNLDTFDFSGTVDVTLSIVEDTATIVMNAKELELDSAVVVVSTGKTDQTHEAVKIDLDKEGETATLHFPVSLPAGSTARLHIEFRGYHNDKMSGFYRSNYTDGNGEKKYMVVTQFEATDARKAFPCWDEPALKATFDATLIVKEHFTALSNMDVVDEKTENGLKTVKFATTPIMSTYLLAFAVGEFDYVETTTTKLAHPVRCRVYTTKGVVEQGKFALGVTPKVLEYFSEVFGIDYPLPKMDMIAVPDFDAGAMENWGLVTYRTSALLFDETKSAAQAKVNIAYVVSHELAHQWFGNLVTMQWWNELWLNEGFATWVGWLAVDHLFPEWDVWTRFLVDTMKRGMDLDSMRSSHPIEVHVKAATEISQIFDAISYCKGASVIRMLSTYLTNDVFLAGIRRYLKRHAYGNASTTDLWKALAEESGRDVGDFMQLWTKRIGHPVLDVSVRDDKSFYVKQTRFLASGDVKEEDDETVWWVPLALANELGSKSEMDVLTKRDGTFDIPKGSWFKLNAGHAGVYRVRYSSEHLEVLARAVKEGTMPQATDRVGILSDAGALAESGHGSTAAVLKLLEAYVEEKEYLVWVELASRIGSIRSTWFEQPQEVRDALESLQRRLAGPKARSLGWEYPEGEEYSQTMLRTLLIGMAGRAGDEAILDEARVRFNKFINGDDSALHPNIRSTVYSMVVKYGGENEWEAVRKIYLEADAVDQKLGALSALGATRASNLIQRAFEFSLDSAVRPQDIIYILRALGDNPAARYPLWEFVKANWTVFEERYRGSLGLLAHVVRCGCGGFVKMEMAEKVKAFFQDKDTKPILRPLEQTLEKIDVNARWLDRAAQEVVAWASQSQ